MYRRVSEAGRSSISRLYKDFRLIYDLNQAVLATILTNSSKLWNDTAVLRASDR